MIANVSQVLYWLGWDGWGVSPEVWAVGMLFAAGGLGLSMLTRQNDIPFNLVLVWAFIGIAVKQSGTAPVSLTAWVLSAFLVFSIVEFRYLVTKRVNKKD